MYVRLLLLTQYTCIYRRAAVLCRAFYCLYCATPDWLV